MTLVDGIKYSNFVDGNGNRVSGSKSISESNRYDNLKNLWMLRYKNHKTMLVMKFMNC